MNINLINTIRNPVLIAVGDYTSDLVINLINVNMNNAIRDIHNAIWSKIHQYEFR
jgi:hypothetical protein